MRSIGHLFLMLSLLAVPALFACGGDTEAAPPETTQVGSTPAATGSAPRAAERPSATVEVQAPARPTVEVQAPARPTIEVQAPARPTIEVHAPPPPSVTVTAPRPPSVRITPPSPGSVEVH